MEKAVLQKLGVWENSFVQWNQNVSRKRMGWILKHWCSLSFSGQEQVSGLSQAIFAPTHASHLDFWAVMEGLSRHLVQHMYIAAARDYFYSNSVVALFTRLCSYHNFPINRKGMPLSEYKRMRQMLQNGLSLMAFAQGTRTRDGGLMPFKPLLAMLALDCNCPIVPVLVKGTFEALPVGRLVPRRKAIRVCFGKPLDPKQEVGKDTSTALTKRARLLNEKLMQSIQVLDDMDSCEEKLEQHSGRIG
jgi:long-chain acyl-CoA synthetase